METKMKSRNILKPIDFEIGKTSVEGNVWNDNSPNITTFFTSSTQPYTTNGSFYYNVYSKNPSTTTTPIEFSIGFGDKRGRGSVKYSQWGDNLTNRLSPTSTIYHQMKSLLGVGKEGFTFGDRKSEYFYIINIDRSGFKEKLSVDNMTITLSKIDDSTPPFEVKRSINLTNDSKYNLPLDVEGVGDVYQMILGENGVMNTQYDTRGWSENEGSYGWYIPQMGIILLNGRVLDEDYIDGGLDLGTNLSYNTEGLNNQKLFSVIDEGGKYDTIPNPNLHRGMTLQSTETLQEKYVYVMIPSTDFNYSNNPTYTTGKEGDLLHEDFKSSPQTYITSVGLYNSNEELVSVVKLSQPLHKDFSKHLMLRCKIDF